jgi:hypothetical protein
VTVRANQAVASGGSNLERSHCHISHTFLHSVKLEFIYIVLLLISWPLVVSNLEMLCGNRNKMLLRILTILISESRHFVLLRRSFEEDDLFLTLRDGNGRMLRLVRQRLDLWQTCVYS